MPRLDGFRRRAFPEPRSLSGKRRCTKPDLKKAPGGSEPEKGSQHEVVQHGLEGDGGVFCQRVAQCQRAMCRQFDNEAFRQRTCRVLVIILAISGVACNRDGRPLHARTIRLLTFARRDIDALPGLRIFARRLIFRPDISAVDGEPPLGIDANKNAGSGDVSRFKDDRPFFERHQGRFDFAEALIDLVGQFVGVLVVEFQLRLSSVVRSAGLPSSSRSWLV